MNQPVSEDGIWMLPSGPYPGLRPFRAHEAALLFGREQQVKDILKRLRRSRFVAIVGGSGSGKSSLIYAGVEPALRSFGLPAAGDFWLSVIATPGTSTSSDLFDDRTDIAANQHSSPVVRFAAKFDLLLLPEHELVEQGRRKPHAGRTQGTSRVDEIARVFRQEGGFARLIEEYGRELNVPPGLDASEARYMFVIDQFEEIFHPTNVSNPDCECMVKRVVEHFFNPHGRCYIALTMRSEHLNDCPRFLGLPEAINRSLYLLPRLDESQLREAIIGPAKRYLRLCMRQSEDPDSLPGAIEFDDKVVQRLLHDTFAIVSDPDHLPLFQHALFRLWEAACQRLDLKGERLPERLDWHDLCIAFHGTDSATEIGNENILRGSLEHWAQNRYASCTASLQSQIDAMLRRLAYKDPNTGAYTQQRISFDQCSGFPGEICNPQEMKKLVNDVFVEPANYMFWDTGTPTRITLKVSHESFIRGWQHFRKLIDEEADRFEEFVTTLKLCRTWVKADQPESSELLSATDLKRIHEKNISDLLKNGAMRQVWFKMLPLDRDGSNLLYLKEHLDRFIELSVKKQDSEMLRRKLSRGVFYGFLSLFFLVLPFALFSLLVQGPVVDRAEHLYDAGSLLGTTPMPKTYLGVGGDTGIVKRLLRSADLINEGRNGTSGITQSISNYVLSFESIGPVRRHEDFLVKTASLVEPPANGTMRNFLSTVIWTEPAGAAANHTAIQPRISDTSCSQPEDDRKPGSGGVQKLGTLLQQDDAAYGTSHRAVFVPSIRKGEGLSVYTASVDASGQCKMVDGVFTDYTDRALILDADLHYMLLTSQDQDDGSPRNIAGIVSLFEIPWAIDSHGNVRAARARPISDILNSSDAATVRAAAGPNHVNAIASWSTPGGVGFSVAEHNWRIISASSAIPFQRAAVDGKLEKLTPANAECEALEKLETDVPRSSGSTSAPVAVVMYQDNNRHCIEIARYGVSFDSSTDLVKQQTAPTLSDMSQFMITVYDKPSMDELSRNNRVLPIPIASLPNFGLFDVGEGEWFVGTSGAHEGWIALRTVLDEKEVLFGAPWSTHALTMLIRTVNTQTTDPTLAGPALLRSGITP